MTGGVDRGPLSTDPNDFCVFDTETRSSLDVRRFGAYNHTANCRVTILTYAIGDEPVKAWVLPTFADGARLDWRAAPEDLRVFHARARAGTAWFVAWNAAFDRLAVNRGIDYGVENGPLLRVEMVIDAMAQGAKSHLPPDLAGAAQYAGAAVKKDAGGKALIALFTAEGGAATPETHPVEWSQFVSYAIDDTAATRSIFWGTMPLDRQEWQEYWAGEHINARGLPLDVHFARRAAQLADLNRARADDAVRAITLEDISTVHQSQRIRDWVLDRLNEHTEAHTIMTREVTIEVADNGDEKSVPVMSLDRPRVEELILFLERLDQEHGLTDEEFAVLRLLEVRLYGASATPGKFAKALDVAEGGVVKGQYVFNGANATGRFSSRGVQLHNLTRATVVPGGRDYGTRADEINAIDRINDAHDDTSSLDVFLDIERRYGPVGRTLSRLIRPAFMATAGKTLFWSDWSAIEARGLPWLADDPDADEVLDVFAANDANPSQPDIYRVQAGLILGKPPQDITGKERQSHGKVPVLSLGFGGGTGALFAMARNYGASFTTDEADEIVQAWRARNPWARRFWDALWTAVTNAVANPGTPFQAGRVVYVVAPGYMRATLVCLLPCGRTLLYPKIRWEMRAVKDKRTGEIEERLSLTYQRGRGRAALWYGLLAENVTQAICGSLLRNTLRVFEASYPGVLVAHTHDEIVGMVDEGSAALWAERLADVMSAPPDWAAGFPLAAAADINLWYTKTET